MLTPTWQNGKVLIQKQMIRSSFSKALASSWLIRFPFKLEEDNTRDVSESKVVTVSHHLCAPSLVQRFEMSRGLHASQLGMGVRLDPALLFLLHIQGTRLLPQK